MYLWLEAFLIAVGITARLIIPAGTAGSGVNLLVIIFIWLALLVHLLDKPRLSAPFPTLPSVLKLLLGLFAAFVIAAFINAPYKFGAFQYLAAWMSDLALFYLVYSLCVRDAKYIPAFLSVFLSVGLMVVLYGLYQHIWELKNLAEQIQQNPSLLDMIPAELQGATLARAAAGEPFATFTYQNSLGAFLALFIPVFIALAVIRQKRWWLGLIVTLISVFVLIQTGSKGAIVALVLGVGLAGAIYYFLKAPSARRGALLAAGFLILIILAGFVIRSQMSGSLNVRLGYWDATVKIIRDNPITGVGLNQFSNSYLYYKTAEAGEVLKAHNDYLQIASELGIPALLVFLGIWFLILKSIFRPVRESNSTLSAPHLSTLPYILGAGFAFCLSEVFQSPLINSDNSLIFTIIVFALWLGAFFFIMSFLRKQESSLPLLRIGLFAGLLAFLIHCTVDFNLYVPGLSMSVWLVGAIFLGTAEPGASLSFLRKQASRIMAVLIAVMIIVLCFVTVRLMKCESFLDQGKTLLRSNVRDEQLAGMDCIIKSFKSNPFSVDASLELAWDMHHVYCPLEANKFFLNPMPACLSTMDFVISLNPLAPMLYNQQGRLCLDHAEQERKNGREKIARIYEQRAKRAFRMVKELYPTYKDKDSKR